MVLLVYLREISWWALAWHSHLLDWWFSPASWRSTPTSAVLLSSFSVSSIDFCFAKSEIHRQFLFVFLRWRLLLLLLQYQVTRRSCNPQNVSNVLALMPLAPTGSLITVLLSTGRKERYSSRMIFPWLYFHRMTFPRLYRHMIWCLLPCWNPILPLWDALRR